MILRKKLLAAAGLLICLSMTAWAQEPESQGIPADVFYLMPSFSQGMIYFRGQSPAQGRLNICAVDNTLRYLDNDGKELAASSADNIVRVQIGDASFLLHQNVFYRMYPLSGEIGVALRRDVRILRDAKQGAYGTTSMTSAITEYGALYSDGVMYDLAKDKDYPYQVSETLFLYRGEDILPLTKNNLKKLFPEKKSEIDAWLKSGHSLPSKVDDALSLLALWAQ